MIDEAIHATYKALHGGIREEQGPVQYWMPLPEPPEEVTNDA